MIKTYYIFYTDVFGENKTFTTENREFAERFCQHLKCYGVKYKLYYQYEGTNSLIEKEK